MNRTTAAARATTILAGLEEAEQRNAVIGLEPSTTGPSASRQLRGPSEVAALWNRGRHDQALIALARLESSGSHFVPGITWETPIVSTENRAYQDVRIGAPRTAARSVDLDFHRGTCNLFAAVSWGDGWSMNISTDGGATWQETYFYPNASEISMKVAGDFAWVSYAPSALPGVLRMRRFSAETGAPDSSYNYHLINSIGPTPIADVAMTSNADDGDSGVYVGFIGFDQVAYFYWDDLVGTSFDPFHPPFGNADGNLDITYNPGGGSGFFLFMSYNSLGAIQVWRLHVFGGWEHVLGYAITGTNTYTAISAYQDTVITMFEADYTNGNGILQMVNYNAGQGGDWVPEVIYFPPTAGAPDAAGADVSLRSPSGSILTYQLEEGAFDGVYFRQRDGHGPGTWENAVSINEFDSASQEQTTVEWLGADCVSSYGVVYLSNATFIPYFDLVTPRFFRDGFESGDTSAWSHSVP